MAEKPKVSFEELSKTCVFRTYQESRCVHEKSKRYRLPGSCQEGICPLSKKVEPTPPLAPEKEEASTVQTR